jgi:hypothetical protein
MPKFPVVQSEKQNLFQSVLTAAHCAKTLILASSSGSVVLHYCAKTLVPAMIEYILKIVPCIVNVTTSDFHTSAIGEIWKALSTLFTYVPETHGLSLIDMFEPTAKSHIR